MTKFHKGFYNVKNPGKYKGDPEKVVYRSSWELRFMNHLDTNKNVIEWASEEFFIPYLSPFPNKQGKRTVRRYFPDFWVKVKKPDGSIKVQIVEVKPKAQCAPPKKTKSGRTTKRYINEQVTFHVNQSKWNAAKEFCADNGFEFVVITEDDLNII